MAYEDLAVKRQKGREAMKRFRERQRQAVIALLGGVCCRCHFSDWRALQVDHIKGNGHAERISSSMGCYQIYSKILKMEHPEDEYQLLCANCNWIKRYENNEVCGIGRRFSQ